MGQPPKQGNADMQSLGNAAHWTGFLSCVAISGRARQAPWAVAQVRACSGRATIAVWSSPCISARGFLDLVAAMALFSRQAPSADAAFRISSGQNLLLRG